MIRFLRLLSQIWSALALLILPSYAAVFNVQKANSDVYIVFVDGELELGDEKRFANAVLNIDDALVVFKSPGGSLRAGLEIGKAIRIKGFATYVFAGEYCASACALAWLGGQTRLMSSTARIGFHGAYLEKNGEKITTSAGNALVGAYLSQLGLSESAIVFITQANPNSISWMSVNDAKKVGISVELYDLSNGTSQRQAPSNTSTPTNAQIRTYEQRAMQFYTEFQTIWSSNNQQSLNMIEDFYDQTITYYGKSVSRHQIMQEKYAFANRWPQRKYFPLPGTVSASCNNSGYCIVSGQIDWTAHSPERRATSVGIAEHELGLQFKNNIPFIVSENGKVLTRQSR